MKSDVIVTTTPDRSLALVSTAMMGVDPVSMIPAEVSKGFFLRKIRQLFGAAGTFFCCRHEIWRTSRDKTVLLRAQVLTLVSELVQRFREALIPAFAPELLRTVWNPWTDDEQDVFA